MSDSSISKIKTSIDTKTSKTRALRLKIIENTVYKMIIGANQILAFLKYLNHETVPDKHKNWNLFISRQWKMV